ncbi:hypothetical protein AAG906_030923 [Vitis piasezkii]
MINLCERFSFKQHNSSMYNASTNGLAEAFNKTLCNLLKKIAYQATYRTPTQATPYSLVYGVEVVLPLERQIPSLRIAIHEGLTNEYNVKLRLQELEALDENSCHSRPIITTHKTRSKFTSKWDGPYVVQEVYTNGAYKMVIEDGLRIVPINGKFLKCYYA